MKVSRSSWHYRLYRYVSNTSRGPAYVNPWTKRARTDPEKMPGSLCPYAWSIFLGLVGALFLVLFAVAFSWLIAIVYAVGFVYHVVSDGLEARAARSRRAKPVTEPEPKPEKKPSLVAAYVKAKKERVCPTIELVD